LFWLFLAQRLTALERGIQLPEPMALPEKPPLGWLPVAAARASMGAATVEGMPRLLALLLLAPLALPALAQDDDLAKAREKVRELETDIQALIDEVSPAVGAIMNYAASFDPATGKVAMAPRSLGSGTIVDPRGFLLTNVHVVAGAGYLTVSLNDGKRYPASLYADTSQGQVKGDIALLKLRGQRRFPFVSWKDGDADKLDPGSFVFAMGNPHGHALDGHPVVTMGIISGKGRAAAEAGYLYIDSIQTDAEINPGNSGGPLFDARGRFVGINGLMQSRQGRSNSGIGFAIPVDQVRLFMRELLRDEGGGVGYGFHGISLETEESGGAVVKRVADRSPAWEAGVRPGDVMHKVNGKVVRNRTEFVNAVGKLPAGKMVSVLFRRGRTNKSAKFRLADFEEFLEETGQKRASSQPLPLHERGFLGVEWRAVEGPAVEITRVLEGSGAEDAGLEPGDVLERIEDTVTAKPDAVVKLLERLEPGTRLKVVVRRAKRSRTFRVDLCDAAMQAGLGE